MIENALASIVIPIYNNKGALPLLMDDLQSVAEHASSPVEFLFVDDCSTDGSAEWVEQFIQAQGEGAVRFSLYRTEVNSGPGVARNVGLENASGEFVSFLDSDDFLAPEAYAELLEYAGSFDRGSSVHGFAFNYYIASDAMAKDVAELLKECQPERRDLEAATLSVGERQQKYLGMEMGGSVIFMLFRRSYLVENSFFFRQGLHEDIDYIWHFYASPIEIKSFDKVVYIKRDRLGSIVNTMSKEHLVGYVEAWDYIVDSALAHSRAGTLVAGGLQNLYSGCSGFVAILVQRIDSQVAPAEQKEMYCYLLDQLKLTIFSKIDRQSLPTSTYYDKITDQFLTHFEAAPDCASSAEFILEK